MLVSCNLHKNQQITAICTRKECDQQSAICQKCILEFHRLCADHIKFLDDIPKEISQILNEVKINKIFESLIQQLKELQQQYQQHFKHINECQTTQDIQNLKSLGSISEIQRQIQTGYKQDKRSQVAHLNIYESFLKLRNLSDQQRIEAQEWREKGRLHYNSNDFYKAIEYYERALSINPQSETYWNFKSTFFKFFLQNALFLIQL